MRPSRHLAVSAVAGAAAWGITREPLAMAVTVAAGVMVDLDHGPDLWWSLALGRRPVAVFLLHGWEWFSGLLAAAIWMHFPWWLTALLLGYGLHLVGDQLVNQGSLWSYFILFRALRRFRLELIAPSWDLTRSYEVLDRELPWASALIRWQQGRRGSPATHTGLAGAQTPTGKTATPTRNESDPP